MSKTLLFLTPLLIFFALLSPTIVLAQDQYFFQDEFNEERAPNTMDPTKWEYYPNTSDLTPSFVNIQENGGWLDLQAPIGSFSFPFVISKNAFPTGDFSYEIKYQFYENGWHTGIGLAEDKPSNTNPISDNLYIAWSQGGNPNVNSSILSQHGVTIYNIGAHSDIRTLRIDRINGIYYFYLNSIFLGIRDVPYETNYIWLGSPAISFTRSDGWTKIKVDYVRVKKIASGKTPLIFIPGIGGSEFKTNSEINWSKDNGHGGIYSNNYPLNETVWVNLGKAISPGNDDYFDILKLKSDGITPEANLTLTGNLFNGAYGGTIDYLTSNGYTLNQDLFIFPYDWRKDLTLTTPLLDQKISEIKSDTGFSKVDILAHSMGGLVARKYISDSNRANNVNKLIELGTPHLGSVDYLQKIHYGGCLKYPVGPYCLSIATNELSDVIQNMPGGYELALTQKYFEFYNNSSEDLPYPFKDEKDLDNNNVKGPLNYSQIKDLLTNLGHNTPLFSIAENFHNLDNNLSNTNGVDVTLIAGSGIGTLGQIIEKNKISIFGISIPYQDAKEINGDDTVPLLSASLNDPSRNLSLLGDAQVFYTNQKHGDLPVSGPAMNLVKNILEDNPQIPSGVSTTPFKVKGVLFSIHSPINILVTDSNNKQTGILDNGDFINDIPGANIDTINDAKFVWLPESGIYTVNFKATDNGQFDFKIRSFDNDQNIKTVLYQNIPITNLSSGQSIIDTNNLDNTPNINLDTGSYPKTQILNNTAASDQTPPITTYLLNGSSNNPWFNKDVQVSLSATDIGGSGISKIEYSFNDQPYQVYSQPFIANKEAITSLKFRATDLAGNTESPQNIDIKIDKTSPEAKAQYNLANQAIEIIGMDNLSPVTVTENPAGQINLVDSAGNKTKLGVLPLTTPRKTINIKNMQYGDNRAIILPSNELTITQNQSYTQKTTIAGHSITAIFNSINNITSIIKETGSDRETFTIPGMINLQLYTNKGQLQSNY